MISKLRPWVPPVYLVLCLLLGGSVQGVWNVAFLQVLGIAILAWAALESGPVVQLEGMRSLTALALAGALVVLLQLVPLPPNVSPLLPGREISQQGVAALGLRPAWMPLSLAPFDTLMTLPSLLPPVAMFVAALRFGSGTFAKGAATLGAVTFVAIVLGVVQSTTSDPGAPFYFYSVSNFGSAIGFFANGNHMATLLLISIPMVVAVGSTAYGQSKEVRKQLAALILMTTGVIILLFGIVLNGSLAGLGLAVPVTLLSVVAMVPFRRGALTKIAAGVVALGLFIAVVVLGSPLRDQLLPDGKGVSFSSREEILTNSRQGIDQFEWAGSGLGTFARVYPLLEEPNEVDRIFVNHAHNDYVEMALELGWAGIALVLGFLMWWSKRAFVVIRSPAADHYAVAASIASATILLHSLVDYPLRTAAIAASFAFCLAMMLGSRRLVVGKDDLRPTRHLFIS